MRNSGVTEYDASVIFCYATNYVIACVVICATQTSFIILATG